MVLPDHLGECPWAMTAVERGAGGHGLPESTPSRRADSVPAMRLRASIAIVTGAIALRLAIGVGFANYDTLYSLVWGQQLARGQTPSYKLPLAPTPHPLLEALGVILAPLGAAATIAIVVALAYLSLAALGYLVYRLGTSWFSWPVGLAATALILSRYEVLSYGVRAYVDWVGTDFYSKFPNFTGLDTFYKEFPG